MVVSWEALVPERIEPERLGVLVAGAGEAVLFERASGSDVQRVLELRRLWRREAGRGERARRAESFARAVSLHLADMTHRLSGLVLLAESDLLGRIRWSLPEPLTRRVVLSLIRAPRPVIDSEIASFLIRYAWLECPVTTPRTPSPDSSGSRRRTGRLRRSYSGWTSAR